MTAKPPTRGGSNRSFSNNYPGTALKRRALAVFLVVTMALSAVAIPAAAGPGLTYGDDAASEVWLDVDGLTVAKHPMSEGATDSDMAGYEDDGGEWVSDPPFVVNDSIGEDVASDELGNRNPYDFNPGHIEDPDFGAFPRVGDDEDDESTDAPASEDNLASALDASEWTEEVNASEGDVTDTTVASGVDAVRINTGSSMVAGDEYVVKYNNWTSELDSDETKRVIQIAADVDTLDADTRVNVSVVDESGDRIEVAEIDSDSTTGNLGVLATSTGSGFVYQDKFSKYTVKGGGSLDNLEAIYINVTDGDADVSISWLDIQSKGKDALGEEVVDDDDDDSDYDNTNTIYNNTAGGDISVSSMATLGPEFDDATITDVTFPAKFRAQDLATEGDDEDYRVTWEESTKYTRPNVLTAEYRLELPDAIDLSYSGATLEFNQAWPDGRYVELGLVEGSGGEEFSQHEEDDDYTDQTGSLASEGDEIELDGTVSVGTEYVVKVVTTFTDDERAAIESSSTDGAAGGPVSSSGGPVDFLMGLPGLIIATVAAVGSRLTGLTRFPWVV